MKRFIIIKTDFPAIHSWPGCDVPGVEFLQHPHRHIFYAVIKFEVTHNDRDIEFIEMKRQIDRYIAEHYREKNLGSKSCEDIAEDIMSAFTADYISVFEDNENGAEIYAE